MSRVSPSFHLLWGGWKMKREGGARTQWREAHARWMSSSRSHQPRRQLEVAVWVSITTVAKYNWHCGYMCQRAATQQLLCFRMQMKLIHSCKHSCGCSHAESSCTQTAWSMQTHAQNILKHPAAHTHTHTRSFIRACLLFLSFLVYCIYLPPFVFFLLLHPSEVPSKQVLPEFCFHWYTCFVL